MQVWPKGQPRHAIGHSLTLRPPLPVFALLVLGIGDGLRRAWDWTWSEQADPWQVAVLAIVGVILIWLFRGGRHRA